MLFHDNLATPQDVGRSLERVRGLQPGPWGGGVFLIGAGFSRSAGVPLAKEIAVQAIQSLASQSGLPRCSPEEALKALIGLKHLPADTTFDNAYQRLFDSAFQSPLAQKQVLRGVIPANPFSTNLAHIGLAELIATHYVHTVLTTNFDRLALASLVRCNILPVIADGHQSITYLSGQPAHPQLCHLHGSIDSYELRNSSQSILAIGDSPSARSTLHDIVKNAQLIVVAGYSGSDSGLMSILRQAFQDFPTVPLFWIHNDKSTSTLATPAVELLNVCKSKWLVLDQDADHLMATILDTVGHVTPQWMRAPVEVLRHRDYRVAIPRGVPQFVRYGQYMHTLSQYTRVSVVADLSNDDIETIRSKLYRYSAMGMYEDVLATLRRATQVRKHPTGLTLLAEAACELGTRAQSLELLEEAVAAYTESANLTTNPHEAFLRKLSASRISAEIAAMTSDIQRLRASNTQLVLAYESEFYRELSLDQQCSIAHAVSFSYSALFQLDESVARQALTAARASHELHRRQSASDSALASINLIDILLTHHRHERDMASLQEAILIANQSIAADGIKKNPEKLAKLLNLQGTAHFAMAIATGNLVHLQPALSSYEDSLKLRGPEDDTIGWLKTQSNQLAAMTLLAASAPRADLAASAHSADFLRHVIGRYDQIAAFLHTEAPLPRLHHVTGRATAQFHLGLVTDDIQLAESACATVEQALLSLRSASPSLSKPFEEQLASMRQVLASASNPPVNPPSS